MRRGLEAAIEGRRIKRVDVLDPRAVRRGGPDLARSLTGTTVGGVRRAGKWLLCDLSDGNVWVTHLRMSGRLLVGRDSDPHLRVRIGIENGADLCFCDQRRFGEMFVLDGPEADDLARRLGPDALDVDARTLARALAGRRGALKAALCNQTIVAGVGNIYSDEALWRARLRWDRLAGSLSPAECRRLAKATRDVLRAALAAGGTSTDGLYVDTAGDTGGFAAHLDVYGREGRPCPRCATPVRHLTRGATSTRFCPVCQA